MKIEGVPFQVTDWETVEKTEYKGEKGTSFWKVFDKGNIRVRTVEYLPGFLSDHYCPRGHVLYVLSGELVIRLKDGQEFTLTAGMSFQAENDENNPHLAYSNPGATVFIVD